MLTLEEWQTIYASAWGGACESSEMTEAGISRILLKFQGLAGLTFPNWRMAAGNPVCESLKCLPPALKYPFLNFSEAFDLAAFSPILDSENRQH